MPNPPGALAAPGSDASASTLPNSQSYDTGQLSGVVLDEVTGLSWQRELSPQQFLWQDAQAYCEQLELAGYADWRLPTRLELVSIVDWARKDPAIDTAAFSGTPGDYFWSGSLYYGSYAYYVKFDAGSVDISSWTQADHRYRARCVRSACPVCADADGGGADDGSADGASVDGASAPAARYLTGTSDGVETVTDTRTRLVWRKAAADSEATWSDAQASCAAVGAGWRLASISELLTIMREDGTLEAPFPRNSSSVFWSSSPLAEIPGYAWTMNLDHGSTQGDEVHVTHGIRCVR